MNNGVITIVSIHIIVGHLSCCVHVLGIHCITYMYVCVCEMCTALVDPLVEINYASRIYRHDL